MNENDLSDLVFKNKKEWGFQNKAHTCKKCTKATPASKKILVIDKRKNKKNTFALQGLQGIHKDTQHQT
jgi:hypothetical protein